MSALSYQALTATEQRFVSLLWRARLSEQYPNEAEIAERLGVVRGHVQRLKRRLIMKGFVKLDAREAHRKYRLTAAAARLMDMRGKGFASVPAKKVTPPPPKVAVPLPMNGAEKRA